MIWHMAYGLVSKPSAWLVRETIDRLEAVLRGKNIHIFARIDQRAEAEKAGLKMPAMELLIFGDPKGGTPLMIAEPTIGIDLPLKAMAWEDREGKVWLSYNSPEYLQDRFSIGEDLIKNISGIAGLIQQALA